jgi:hypothetical protein
MLAMLSRFEAHPSLSLRRMSHSISRTIRRRRPNDLSPYRPGRSWVNIRRKKRVLKTPPVTTGTSPHADQVRQVIWNCARNILQIW